MPDAEKRTERTECALTWAGVVQQGVGIGGGEGPGVEDAGMEGQLQQLQRSVSCAQSNSVWYERGGDVTRRARGGNNLRPYIQQRAFKSGRELPIDGLASAVRRVECGEPAMRVTNRRRRSCSTRGHV